MPTLSGVLKQLIQAGGLTISELSRLTGILQPVLYRLVMGHTDNPKIQTLLPIAHYFEITVGQLVGLEPLPGSLIRHSKIPSHTIPLIPWEALTQWPDFHNDDMTCLITTQACVGEKSFALPLKDSTLLPRFAKDTQLIVDPQRTARNADWVIVQLTPEVEPTLKQVFFDGTDIYLKPLNPDFKTLPLDQNTAYRFLGVVVEAKIALIPFNEPNTGV